ncbi:MAG: radical SAM protein [Desulfatibacillaceae bacterium]
MSDILREPPVRGVHPHVDGRWGGNSAAVIEIAYCNMRCPYCNVGALVLAPHTLPPHTTDQVLEELSTPGTVVVTGGEPSMHRTLPVLLRGLKEAGHFVVLETNGTQPDMLRLLAEKGWVDHVVVSVKAPLDEDAYERCAGVFVPPELVEESLDVLLVTGVEFSMTTVAVPALLSVEDLLRLADRVRRFGPLDILDYNPASPMDAEAAGGDIWTPEQMARIREMLKAP